MRPSLIKTSVSLPVKSVELLDLAIEAGYWTSRSSFFAEALNRAFNPDGEALDVKSLKQEAERR